MYHTFEKPEDLQAVEIWNETKKKKVGTFKLQNLDSTSDFEHHFKNSNIVLKVKKGEQPIDPKDFFDNLSSAGSITFGNY